MTHKYQVDSITGLSTTKLGGDSIAVGPPSSMAESSSAEISIFLFVYNWSHWGSDKFVSW